MAQGTGERASTRQWMGLAVLVLPCVLASMDMSVDHGLVRVPAGRPACHDGHPRGPGRAAAGAADRRRRVRPRLGPGGLLDRPRIRQATVADPPMTCPPRRPRRRRAAARAPRFDRTLTAWPTGKRRPPKADLDRIDAACWAVRGRGVASVPARVVQRGPRGSRTPTGDAHRGPPADPRRRPEHCPYPEPPPRCVV